MYTLTKGQLPIVGVGGVASGEDAYAKIRAGELVQPRVLGLKNWKDHSCPCAVEGVASARPPVCALAYHAGPC